MRYVSLNWDALRWLKDFSTRSYWDYAVFIPVINSGLA
ncbi:hypothetical protein GPUN_1633 [Glaciecola punicea ACAM 611]|uniref:Uncharacterized protein n=1 Tax=Glaciecola punicea ACAM 611 TaxID=1121923 RepID=H5TBS3_9ALTE|nr:hypothetical protein GPUN_1633 [Glaciecola punicea ACAM 611]